MRIIRQPETDLDVSARGIRVLYVQPAADFGGAERQAATIVPLLGEFGVEAIPLVGPGSEITRWLSERGVDDFVLSKTFPGAWTKPSRLARLGLPLRYVRCCLDLRAEIARLIRERRIDVVLAAMAFSWVAATPVARALGVPIVWRAGGTECAPVERRILSVWARWNKPDHLICNGDAVRRTYGPLIDAPASIIRNGLDSRQFHPAAGDPARLRPPGARVVIGFAARLVPQKRPEDFIAAAARHAHRDDVAFLLAGDGSRRPLYAAMAREAGARTLHVTGYLPDMRDFYAACDVLVLPSRSEGCPNVVLEAMAMRTAVVAADVPAVREIVTSGLDGVLYPLGDIDALHGVLTSLLDQPERRQLLIARAARRVAQLTARSCAARTAAVLRDVVASRAPRSEPAPPPGMALPA
ncbi:MAG TPA: glycosyltransferase [Kofleriaceae bacterium]|jgi:glycosyltransferase involved in cell wall biosynthesis|nr:glycosyltransferase [Kofleriaceae bacterium]